MGICEMMVDRTSSETASNMGVSVGPGLTTFTRMPRGCCLFETKWGPPTGIDGPRPMPSLVGDKR